MSGTVPCFPLAVYRIKRIVPGGVPQGEAEAAPLSAANTEKEKGKEKEGGDAEGSPTPTSGGALSLFDSDMHSI